MASNLLSRAQAIVSAFVSSPHDGIIFSLAAPAILALAADPLLAMVDTAIVGHLGQNELVSGPLGGACMYTHAHALPSQASEHEGSQRTCTKLTRKHTFIARILFFTPVCWKSMHAARALVAMLA